MRYPALIDFDGDRIVAEFPDCPGCEAAVAPEHDIVAAASAALHRWLESCLAGGTIPPKPSAAVVSRDWFEWVPIEPDLTLKLLLRWATAKRISRHELASRAGISDEELAALEDQSAPPSAAALDGVARALGVAGGGVSAQHPERDEPGPAVKSKASPRRRRA